MDWKRDFKTELFQQFARIGKAMANSARIELLDLLSQAERTVEQLADLTEMSVANVSQHLQILRRAQRGERDSTRITGLRTKASFGSGR
jgi:predicted transcriptional regulator